MYLDSNLINLVTLACEYLLPFILPDETVVCATASRTQVGGIAHAVDNLVTSIHRHNPLDMIISPIRRPKTSPCLFLAFTCLVPVLLARYPTEEEKGSQSSLGRYWCSAQVVPHNRRCHHSRSWMCRLATRYMSHIYNCCYQPGIVALEW